MGSTKGEVLELEVFEQAQVRAKQQLGDLELTLDRVSEGAYTVEHEEAKYVIRQLSPVVEEEADVVYNAKRFSLMEHRGLPTEAALRKRVRERGDWTDEQEQELEDLATRQGELEFEIRVLNEQIVEAKEPSPEIAEVIAEAEKKTAEVAVVRREHMGKSMEQATLFSGTVEAMAGNERRLFLLHKLVYREDNKVLLWKTLDDVKTEKNVALFQAIFSSALLFWAGLRPEVRTRFLEE